MSPLTLLTRHSPYSPRPAEIIELEHLSPTVNRLVLRTQDGGGFDCRPGQFVMLSIAGVGEAPFSISRLGDEPGSFEVAVHRCGLVTEAVHRLDLGAPLGFRGPYGTAFPIEDFASRDLLLLAGGLGYIPLRSLLFPVLENRDDYGRVMLLTGFRCLADAIFQKEIDELAKREDLEILRSLDANEEGWAEHCGLAPELIAKARPDAVRTVAAMVGPPIMLPMAIQSCRELGMSDEQIYVSLERRMHCGVGKCGHCQLNGLSICVDGPVFRLPELQSMPEAREVLA